MDESSNGAIIFVSQSASGRMLSESTRAISSPFAAAVPAALPASPVLSGFGTIWSTPFARAISSVASEDPASAITISYSARGRFWARMASRHSPSVRAEFSVGTTNETLGAIGIGQSIAYRPKPWPVMLQFEHKQAMPQNESCAQKSRRCPERGIHPEARTGAPMLPSLPHYSRFHGYDYTRGAAIARGTGTDWEA